MLFNDSPSLSFSQAAEEVLEDSLGDDSSDDDASPSSQAADAARAPIGSQQAKAVDAVTGGAQFRVRLLEFPLDRRLVVSQ